MTVPGVFPAKLVIKMLPSKGRNKTGKLKERKGKGNLLGRKMSAPSGAPGLNRGEGKKTEMELVETTRKVLVMRDTLKHLEMMAGHLGESGRAPGIYPAASPAGDRLEVLFRGFGSTQFL